jgi:hypothetical protein
VVEQFGETRSFAGLPEIESSFSVDHRLIETALPHKNFKFLIASFFIAPPVGHTNEAGTLSTHRSALQYRRLCPNAMQICHIAFRAISAGLNCIEGGEIIGQVLVCRFHHEPRNKGSVFDSTHPHDNLFVDRNRLANTDACL